MLERVVWLGTEGLQTSLNQGRNLSRMRKSSSGEVVVLLLVNHSLSEPGTSTWTSDLNLEDYTPGQERGCAAFMGFPFANAKSSGDCSIQRSSSNSKQSLKQKTKQNPIKMQLWMRYSKGKGKFVLRARRELWEEIGNKSKSLVSSGDIRLAAYKSRAEDGRGWMLGQRCWGRPLMQVLMCYMRTEQRPSSDPRGRGRNRTDAIEV